MVFPTEYSWISRSTQAIEPIFMKPDASYHHHANFKHTGGEKGLDACPKMIWAALPR